MPVCCKDQHYGAAIAVAPFFWCVLFLLLQPQLKLAWPLADPLRFLLAALIYPVLEEATFRGLLQPALHRRAWGARRLAGLSRANWLTSLLFAASHLLWHSPAQAAAVLAPSLLFGHFRDRYGVIGPSVALHVFYNAGFVLLFGGRA